VHFIRPNGAIWNPFVEEQFRKGFQKRHLDVSAETLKKVRVFRSLSMTVWRWWTACRLIKGLHDVDVQVRISKYASNWLIWTTKVMEQMCFEETNGGWAAAA
jgi:hypothetical protein